MSATNSRVIVKHRLCSADQMAKLLIEKLAAKFGFDFRMNTAHAGTCDGRWHFVRNGTEETVRVEMKLCHLTLHSQTKKGIVYDNLRANFKDVHHNNFDIFVGVALHAAHDPIGQPRLVELIERNYSAQSRWPTDFLLEDDDVLRCFSTLICDESKIVGRDGQPQEFVSHYVKSNDATYSSFFKTANRVDDVKKCLLDALVVALRRQHDELKGAQKTAILETISFTTVGRNVSSNPSKTRKID